MCSVSLCNVVVQCAERCPCLAQLKALMRRSKPLSVMDLLSGWCSDIVSSAQSFISSTWTFYLQADDGKVLVFQVRRLEVCPRHKDSVPALKHCAPAGWLGYFYTFLPRFRYREYLSCFDRA